MTETAKILIEKSAIPTLKESVNIGKNMLRGKLEAYQKKNRKFEELRGMDADTFSRKFNNGDLGDDKEWIEWDHVISVINVLETKIRDIENITYEH